MTRRAAAAFVALSALALASSALLTACGPDAPPASGPDTGQVQQMQQKVNAAESAAAQADDNAGQDN
ncbi:hypothetical protein [Kitasatospora sp. CB01950]|uniref:hypothetical protein n=1 Tax=Kitasatospora sp. CB01950 TaxID=1703930 RepID=UPI00093AA3A6|nr:hypothetical protein [Kitasatospora sp. CB01950]OKJ16028.1 hypothetical protein AMK19_07595 [Kitasatospora sp. CB01950]